MQSRNEESVDERSQLCCNEGKKSGLLICCFFKHFRTNFNAFVRLMLKQKEIFASVLSYYFFFLIELYCNSLRYQLAFGRCHHEPFLTHFSPAFLAKGRLFGQLTFFLCRWNSNYLLMLEAGREGFL